MMDTPMTNMEQGAGNVQQTRDAYAAFLRGDIAAVLANHADDIE